jgi:Mrp family chromosome partitioning ATPase
LPAASSAAAARTSGRRPIDNSAPLPSAPLAHRRHRHRRTTAPSATAAAPAPQASPSITSGATPEESQVLDALRRVIDPDFGADVVACGFVKRLRADASSGLVSFELELTTPACPVKEQFKREAEHYVGLLEWVKRVDVRITAQPGGNAAAAAAAAGDASSADNGRPGGLRSVKHIVAVSSCKGGVGKSTTAVNLAYTLAQMGAKVGILDADVYGPSLPTMVSPDPKILRMDPETRALTPADYLGVKLVSFGFAGQGSAIMRGAMVSGLIQQLLTTAEWGELDYLILDFPPGTGDIQLTLCQSCAITAAVIVTTPQKLAFVDVAKGIRMFARLAVPCVSVVENMAYFDGDDGKRYRPFGDGASGERVQRDFGVPNLVPMPISPELSRAGDGGVPLVVSDPTGAAAGRYMELGAAVVREIARATAAVGGAGGGAARAAGGGVTFDSDRGLVRVAVPASTVRALSMMSNNNGGAQEGEAAAAAASAAAEPFWLEPRVVRASDTSAAALDEWTGAPLAPALPEEGHPLPLGVQPLGNYAVQISWSDGFNQVAPYEVLLGLRAQAVSDAEAARRGGGGSGEGDDRVVSAGGVVAEARIGG